jgi:hypothetical protein
MPSLTTSNSTSSGDTVHIPYQWTLSSWHGTAHPAGSAGVVFGFGDVDGGKDGEVVVRGITDARNDAETLLAESYEEWGMNEGVKAAGRIVVILTRDPQTCESD